MINKRKNIGKTKEKPKAQLFKDSLQKHDLQAVLFDFDDTLIYTHELFVSQMAKYRDAVLGKTNKKEKEQFDQRINDSLKKHYPTVSISPRIWEFATADIKEFYGENAVSPANLALLYEIYRLVPRLREGSVEVLTKLQDLNIPMGLVTHASPGWTDFKLNSTGLKRFFSRVATIDDSGFKTGKEWHNSIVGFGYRPQNVLVVGDNIKGDIQAASSIGVKHLVWLDTQATWSLYREGGVPDGTKVIKKIVELLDY